MEHKTLTYSVKELKAPDSTGSFLANIAETWPENAPKANADSDGDIFLTGAFDEQDGQEVPVFYQHTYVPTSEIGTAQLLPGTSREHLPAKGQLYVGQGKPIADAIHESMLLPETDPMALREFSVGYEFDAKDITMRPDGVRVIRKSKVMEVSVVYAGAQRTELVSVKHQAAGSHVQAAHDALVKAGAKCSDSPPASDEGKAVEPPAYSTEDQWGHKQPIDEGAWDGAAAMQTCNTAKDFASIAFERNNTSDPASQAHWALPHHARPGAPPNVRGVGAAVGALEGARGGAPDLKDEAAARKHLEAHQATIENARKEDGKDAPVWDALAKNELEEYRLRVGLLLA